jgi:ABC-type tungstate transport system permease subunit
MVMNGRSGPNRDPDVYNDFMTLGANEAPANVVRRINTEDIFERDTNQRIQHLEDNRTVERECDPGLVQFDYYHLPARTCG